MVMFFAVLILVKFSTRKGDSVEIMADANFCLFGNFHIMRFARFLQIIAQTNFSRRFLLRNAFSVGENKFCAEKAPTRSVA